MSPLLSRIAVIAAGLPLVLFAAYYGGWALLALLAPAALLALHELYRMGRALRPLVLAGYGVVLFAVALFFAGMSTKLTAPRLRTLTLVIGSVVFLGTVVWIATFPVSLSV